MYKNHSLLYKFYNRNKKTQICRNICWQKKETLVIINEMYQVAHELLNVHETEWFSQRHWTAVPGFDKFWNCLVMEKASRILILWWFLGLGTTKNKVPRYTAVFSRVLLYVPRYTATVLNFAEVIVKLPAVVAIWLICQHLMVYTFVSLNHLNHLCWVLFSMKYWFTLYIIIRNLYFKLKSTCGQWRLEIHVGP